MNTPVSFEIAKLLKEKGFDKPTKVWRQSGNGVSGIVEGKRDYYNRKGEFYTALPTIAEVVMWLYEKHGIWVFPEWQFGRKMWLGTFHDITSYENTIKVQDKYYEDMGEAEYNSPTEAYSKAIEYVLNNLI